VNRSKFSEKEAFDGQHQKLMPDVLSGVNLPMVLRASQERKGRCLGELALLLRDYGQHSILLASDILDK